MADQQKIHPVVDVEAPPTAPLMPNNARNSEKGDPPPPIRRTIPLIQSRPPRRKKSGCRCCRFICWAISVSILLVIIIAATTGILYLVFRPKLPKYSIDRLRISDFTLNPDASLNAQFSVRITARNPNKKIGIYYENGNHMSVYYTDIMLCQGSLPKFYQGHSNTTVVDAVLTGHTENAANLFTTLSQQQMQTGNIPLKLNADVPVRVEIGKLKLRKVNFLVRCELLVDNLISPNNLITIRTSHCNFKPRL